MSTNSLATPPPVQPTPAQPTPEALSALRRDMLRYARLQLSDRAAAEDAVHDALEAALRCRTSFNGRSALKTWLFGILRHKLADHHRSTRRQPEPWNDDDEAQLPGPWPEPHDSLERHRFWQQLLVQVDSLSPVAGQVFVMKDLLGWETDEIVQELGITAGHCHVILHRTRARLRERLAPAYRAKNA